METNSKQVRSKILNAAYKVFSQDGFHQGSIRQISKKSSYGAPTIYYHFKNKEILCKRTVSATHKGLLKRLYKEKITNNDSVYEYCSRYFETLFAVYQLDSNIFRFLFVQTSTMPSHIFQQYANEYLPQLNENFIENLVSSNRVNTDEVQMLTDLINSTLLKMGNSAKVLKPSLEAVKKTLHAILRKSHSLR